MDPAAPWSASPAPSPAGSSSQPRSKPSWVLVEIATIVLVVLIVGITFRSFGAPAVALLAGVVSYLVALPVIAWTGSRLGFDVPAEVEPLIVVLLLGIVTDYTIFYLSGTRQRLATAGVATPRREGRPRSSHLSS